MSTFIRFRYSPIAGMPQSILILASTAAQFDGADFSTKVEDDFRENLRADGVLIICPSHCQKEEYRNEIRSLINSEVVFRYDMVVIPVHVACYDASGGLDGIIHVCGPAMVLTEATGGLTKPRFLEILTEGLIEIA